MDIGNFSYYILGEVVTCILSAVLCVNILASFTPTEQRQRIFLLAGVSSFFATFFDVIAVFCITYYKTIPLWCGTISSSVFFIFLLMVPMALCSYAIDLSFSYNPKRFIFFNINGIISVFWITFILINIKTGWLFKYTVEDGYVRGPLKNITYALMAYFVVMTMTSVIINRKSLPGRIFFTFMFYPVVTALFVMFQFFFPKVIMTGAASFSGLLMAYLTIQADMLEFDSVTGLLCEHKLQLNLEKRRTPGFFFVLDIENFNFIQNNFSVANRNQLLLDIGNEFSHCFQRHSYHITSGRFAGVCDTKEQFETYSKKIRGFIDTINKQGLYDIPAPLEVYYAAIEFTESENSKNYTNIVEIINTLLEKGKNNLTSQIQICDESILLDMERKRQIYKILKRELTLDSKQFEVWYQPIYSISQKKFTYMEALSRLNNTELGNISPQEFVEVAERRGLIEKLGFVAFEKICKFIADNKGLVNAISINFSVYQMSNPNLVETVLSTIARFGLRPDNIIMEITESCFINDFELVFKNMTELAKAGIQFYLDDFGTGYSNLSNVVNLPFKTIKMDRSLVLMMEDNPTNITLFRNLVSTFKGAELNILVEGVETNNQNHLVCDGGVDYIQGFLYSKPLPPEKCIEFLKEQQ